MRMSMSPQSGGFHRCTGGRPRAPSRRAAPTMVSRPFGSACLCFAMVHPTVGRDALMCSRERDAKSAPVGALDRGREEKVERTAGPDVSLNPEIHRGHRLERNAEKPPRDHGGPKNSVSLMK